jgi:uncharacterized protein
MTLKEHINKDLISAIKGKEKDKALVLRTLNATIKNAEIAKRSKLSKTANGLEDLGTLSVLTDEEVTGVIASQIKQRRDSAAEFEKGNRPDLVEKEKKEIEILAHYMPEQMSEDEIKKIVADAIAETGAVSVEEMGKVMALAMGRTKGRTDGATVSGIAKKLLAK